MATEVGLAYVRLIPSMDGFHARARTMLDRELSRLSGDFTVRLNATVVPGDVDTSRLTRDVDAQARKLSDSLSRVGSLAGGLGRVAAGIGAIGAAGGAAIPPVAGLVATLLEIAPAAGLAATGLLAMTTANAALKLGVMGVGDALKYAFDPEQADKFAEAMAELSPNAQSFVQTIRDLRPAFDGMQLAVQDRLFAGLGETLRGTAEAVQGQLGPALGDAASSLNLMGQRILTTATGLSESGALGQAMDSATDGLRSMASLPATVVQGFVQLAAAAGPSFSRLTEQAGGALDSISQRMTAAFESGAMQDAIENAIALIGDLVEVAGNIGGIVGSIFGAAQASGAGFVGTLQQITGALNEAFASPEVQDALGALFDVMADLASTAGPLLVQALSAIAPVFATLGPPVQQLIAALGDALEPVIAALGPVLDAAAQAVGALITAALPLLPLVGELVAALLPSLTPLLQTVEEIFRALAPVVAELATGLGQALQPVLEGLGDVLGELAGQFAAQFLQILQMLLPVMPQLIAYGVMLGQSLGQILTALAPLLPQIMLLATQMMTQLLPALLPLLPPLLQLSTIFLRLATWTLTRVVIPAISGLISIIGGLRAALQPGIDAVRWLTNGIADLFRWLYDLLVGNSIIPDLISRIVSLFAGLPSRAFSALAQLGPRIVGRMTDAAGRMIRAAARGVTSAVREVGRLPGRARDALGNLGSTLWNAGASLISGFIDGIQSKFDSVRNTLGSLTSALTSWKGPESLDRVLLTPAGRLLIEGFQRGIDDQVPALRSQLQGLTGGLSPLVAAEVSATATQLPLAAGTARAGAAAPPVLRMVADGSRASRALMAVLQDAVRIDYGGDPVAALAPRR